MVCSCFLPWNSVSNTTSLQSALSKLAYGFTHVDRVGSLLGDSSDGTHSSRRKHNLVVVDERVFVDTTEDITTGNVVSDSELSRLEVPGDVSVKGFSVDTTWTISWHPLHERYRDERGM